MKLLFFQNCVSPHQIPYIKEIHKDIRIEEVILIAPRVNLSDRTVMGWNSCDLLNETGITFILKPSLDKIKEIFQQNEIIAFFSGIRADKDVFEWFKISLKFQIKRGLITEPPNISPTKPLFLHCLRFLLLDYKYIKYIDYVYTFGDLAFKYYHFWNKKWKIIPFAYCTQIQNIYRSQNLPTKNNILHFIFIGSLTKRKNVRLILKVFANIQDPDISLNIIGDGTEKEALMNYAMQKKIKNISFSGSLPNNRIATALQNADVLILPSKHDGWGAVVNEALQMGVYVICSEHCGSKTLIVHDKIGSIFKSYNDFFKITTSIVTNKEIIKNGRDFRKKWSKKISGPSLAKYFVDSLFESHKIEVPWKIPDK